MPGELTFTPTEADYVAAVRANFLCSLRRPRALRNFAIIIALGAVLGAALGFLNGMNWFLLGLLGGIAYGVLVWGGICLGSLLLLPRRSARLFRQQRSIHQAFVYRWSDDGLDCEFQTSNVRTPWSDFRGFRDVRPAMLLYMNDQLFQFLPHRALDDESARDLRETIARAAVSRY